MKNDPIVQFMSLTCIKALDVHCKHALLIHYSTDVTNLENGTMTSSEAIKLLCRLRLTVTTEAALKLFELHGYLFDCLIIPDTSQKNTVLQYTYCAKISDPRTIGHEINTISAIRSHFKTCPTIISVLDSFELDKSRMCVIYPFLPKSLADLGIQRQVVPDSIVIRAALCGLATIKAMSSVGICHGDIKPSNMMVDNNSDIIVTIDFGASTRYDSFQRESTRNYSMDVYNMSIEYDLTCLCSSILQLKGVDIFNTSTRSELLQTFSDNPNPCYRIAMLCLRQTNIDAIITEVSNISGIDTEYVEKVMPKI